MAKTIEELGALAVKRRLKALYALDSLSDEQKDERRRLEAREWALYRLNHPPIKTPPNFIEKDKDW